MQDKKVIDRLNNPPVINSINDRSLVDIIQEALNEFEDANLGSEAATKHIAENIYNVVMETMIEPTTADEFNKPIIDRNDLIVRYIKERLDVGQLKYGKSIPKDDGRNMEQEALEEIFDGMVYIANKLLDLDGEEEWLSQKMKDYQVG